MDLWSGCIAKGCAKKIIESRPTLPKREINHMVAMCVSRERAGKERKKLTLVGCVPLMLKKKGKGDGGYRIDKRRDSEQEMGDGELPPRKRAPRLKKVRGRAS
jgi:hypothetical protein